MATNRKVRHKKYGTKKPNQGIKVTPADILGTSSAASPARGPSKGIYTEYLDKRMTPDQLQAERKKQLMRISKIRDRAILVYAADFQKAQVGAPTGIDLSDKNPLKDQVSVLSGDRLDVILQTPGGLGEVAEDIVKMLRRRFSEVNFIVPGTCMSAGTIMAMAGDEILMDHDSSLGPIDAQIQNQGKQFSAEALIQGVEDIKKEVDQKKHLNQAYIPILQSISPGELRHAENAMEFARVLVREWLVKYKFKNWTHRKRDNSEVTDADRIARANDISKALSNHNTWLTHGRSIKIDDLRAMELEITDYEETPELNDAITRYKILLDLSFKAMPLVYKIVETPTSQIVRHLQQMQPAPQGVSLPAGSIPANASGQAELQIRCPLCGTPNPVAAGLGEPLVAKAGFTPFPKDNQLKCQNCGNIFDVKAVRAKIEKDFGRKIVDDQEQPK